MSYQIQLLKSQPKELKKLLKQTTDTKILKRYQSIHFKTQGLTNTQVAKLLDVNIDTITDWYKLFNKGGFKLLGTLNYDGRRVSQLEQHKEEIKSYVEKNIVPGIAALQDYILKTHKVSIEHSWLFRYCKKNSISVIKKQSIVLRKQQTN